MRFAIVFLVIAMAVPLVPAHAATGQVVWPTFFRVGPSKHDLVVDELFRGTSVDVRSCTDQWCLVQYGRVLGYVERAALNANDFPAAGKPVGTGCFDSVRAGYGKGETLRYCQR